MHIKLGGQYAVSDTAVAPANGKRFTLDELQGLVGGTIDIARLPEIPGNLVMVMNDNGKLLDLRVNEIASEIWRAAWPIGKYPYNNDGTIVGDVLIAPRSMV